MTEQTCEHEAAEENSRSLWHYEVAQAHPRPVESCGKCEQIYETETGITITVIVSEPDDIDDYRDGDDQDDILMRAVQKYQDEAEPDRFSEVISETCDQCGKTGHIILVESLKYPMGTFVAKTDDGRKLCQECEPAIHRRRSGRVRISRPGETARDTGEGETRA